MPEIVINAVDEGATDGVELMALENNVRADDYEVVGQADDGQGFRWDVSDDDVGYLNQGEIFWSEEGRESYDCPFIESDDWSVVIEDSNGSVVNAIHKGSKVLSGSGPVLTKQTDTDHTYYRTADEYSNTTSDWDYEESPFSYQGELNPGQSGNFTEPPSNPRNVSLTYDANDQLTASWDEPSDWGGEQGKYYFLIERDGDGFNRNGENFNVDVGNEGFTFTPVSDEPYSEQIGIDSSFRYRVRAENSAGNSGYEYSSTVYTEPIPPHNPSVSRPDGNTFKISWTPTADIGSSVVIKVRENTGNGYGSWDTLESVSGGSATFTTGTEYSYGVTLKENAQYQFKLRTNQGSGPHSKYVYADYGNEGNVYFEDDFESGDLSEWGSTNLADDWGVYDSSFVDANASGDSPTSTARIHPVQGPDEGTYYLFGDGDGYVETNLGDLSNESDVIVKCSMAVSSMDSESEEAEIKWYDGSSWNDLETMGWEYNRQGWVETASVVPSSWLSTDNRLRLHGHGGSGEYAAWDRVVVSDILHEYVPTAPTSLSTSSGETEITATWEHDMAFGQTGSKAQWQYATDGSVSLADPDAGSETFTGLKASAEYDVSIWGSVEQYRRGDVGTVLQSDSLSETVTTGGNGAAYWDDLAWSGETDATGATTNELGDSRVLEQGYDHGNLTEGLVAYYPFDGDVNDHALNNDGTNNGGTFVEGKVRDGIKLEASNTESVQVPHHPTLEPKTITFCAWAKSLNPNWNNRGILGTRPNDNDGGYLIHPSFGDKEFQVYIHTTSSGWTSVTHTLSDIEMWHHYVGTYDGTTLRMYVDGEQVGSTNIGEPIEYVQDGLEIGEDYNIHADAIIDEVRIYDRALSEPEITALYELTQPSDATPGDTLQ